MHWTVNYAAIYERLLYSGASPSSKLPCPCGGWTHTARTARDAFVRTRVSEEFRSVPQAG
jgi:hypothetical protein